MSAVNFALPFTGIGKLCILSRLVGSLCRYPASAFQTAARTDLSGQFFLKDWKLLASTDNASFYLHSVKNDQRSVRDVIYRGPLLHLP